MKLYYFYNHTDQSITLLTSLRELNYVISSLENVGDYVSILKTNGLVDTLPQNTVEIKLKTKKDIHDPRIRDELERIDADPRENIILRVKLI